jgi:ribosomal protein S18 acetylase RimI-like enzyme
MAEPSTRPATAADVPALLEMMVDFNALEKIPWTPAAGEAPLRGLLAAPDVGIVHLIVESDAVRGYFILTWGYDLEHGGKDGMLTELYLRPDARGGGLGRTAMATVEEVARAHGLRALHLLVRPENVPAVRLYHGAGFTAPPRVFLSKKLA